MDNSELQQVYNVYSDTTSLAKINNVICVFMRRGILSAGYNAANELLTIHFNGYKNNRPAWDTTFFEQVITNDALLSAAKNTRFKILSLTEKTMVIPNALYENGQAEQWMETIHYKDIKDDILTTHLEEEKLHILQIVPREITQLIKINYGPDEVLPLMYYQCRRNDYNEQLLRCCITNEQVVMTLHLNKMLLWHRICDYSNAADIAFEILDVCRQQQLDHTKLIFESNCTTAAERTVMSNLGNFFKLEPPSVVHKSNASANSSKWIYPISLFQEIRLCVS